MPPLITMFLPLNYLIQLVILCFHLVPFQTTQANNELLITPTICLIHTSDNCKVPSISPDLCLHKSLKRKKDDLICKYCLGPNINSKFLNSFETDIQKEFSSAGIFILDQEKEVADVGRLLK